MTIPEILNLWNVHGMDYLLVFLLVFAFTFGVLSAAKIFGKNKMVHVLIALVLGLMSLKSGLAVDFMSRAFPKAAVAISIIIIMVILTAFFIPKEDDKRRGWMIAYYSVAAVAFVFVVFNTFSEVIWYSSQWWYDWGGLIIGALLIIGVIVGVALTTGDDQ